jgi:hypothetical protein
MAGFEVFTEAKQFRLQSMLDCPESKWEKTPGGREFREPFTVADAVEAFHDKNPGCRVYFIEGLQVGQANSNEYGATSSVLRKLNALCEKHGLTIVGTTHTAKPHNGVRQHGREAILGSVATGGMTELIVEFTPRKDGDKKKVRVSLFPRQEAEFELWYEWEGGSLVESTEPEGDPIWLQRLKACGFNADGAVVTRDSIKEAYPKRNYTSNDAKMCRGAGLS